MNYFDVFGLPRILNIDLHALEKSFHELSRKYHPDYFTTGTPEEKQQALEITSQLNDAYRTLRHPIRRVEYLLTSEGFKADGSKVPQSFLMDIFEINEQLEEIKTGSASPAGKEALRGEIHRKTEVFTDKIAEATHAWDELVRSGAPESEKKQQLLKMTEILSEFSYIRNLERDLEETH